MQPVSSNATNLDFTQFAVLDDMRRFDCHVVSLYWAALTPQVRQRGWGSTGEEGLRNFQAEFDTMVDNWFAIILIDMARSSVAERKEQKTQKDLEKMMTWAERTTARVFLMAAARRWEQRRKPLANRSRLRYQQQQPQQVPQSQYHHDLFRHFDVASSSSAPPLPPSAEAAASNVAIKLE